MSYGAAIFPCTSAEHLLDAKPQYQGILFRNSIRAVAASVATLVSQPRWEWVPMYSTTRFANRVAFPHMYTTQTP
eukprot:6943428-Pyramimonas_sp.AAC.1